MRTTLPAALIILDGFGQSTKKEHNAIALAHTPNLDQWYTTYPSAILKASGEAVGLLEGYIGNSEIGHITIGAGRRIAQPILLWHRMLDDKSFFKNQVLIDSFGKLARDGGRLHLMGLLSDAGVHSHDRHLHALLELAHQLGISEVFVHAFLDGRDVPPRSAVTYLERLEKFMSKIGVGVVASLHGRFYAMDRDKNWERTERSYQILTQPNQSTASSWQSAVENNYQQENNDEFIEPALIVSEGTVRNGDGIVFFNTRADRARQITSCFADPQSVPFKPSPPQFAFFITGTPYDHFPRATPLIQPLTVPNTFKEKLAEHGIRIFAIAETEKYAHVTYFFNGGKEEKQPGETWTLIPSLPRKNYVDRPEMSAHGITEAVLTSLANDPHDFYLINYANADMVGHSGNLEGTVKAIECLDRELGRLFDAFVTQQHGTMFITADHGNAEDMFDEEAQQPRTAHSLNPVPFLVLQTGLSKNEPLPLAELGDIAPFILRSMNIPVPKQMHRNNTLAS